MGKKESEKEVEEATAPEDVGAQATDVEPQPAHWRIGHWGRFRQYQCRYCPFDALEEATIQAHYQAIHVPVQPPPVIVLADRFGRPVEE